jgi:hypothetical protein
MTTGLSPSERDSGPVTKATGIRTYGCSHTISRKCYPMWKIDDNMPS